MKIAGFDLETTDRAPESYGASYELGVSCAAIYLVDGSQEQCEIFAPKTRQNWETRQEFYPLRMTQNELQALGDRLRELHNDGYIIVTINGAGFDFRVLHECGVGVAAHLACNHVDVAFNLFAQRGFMFGMDKMAKCLGLKGKTGMDGLGAIQAWATQSLKQQQEVLHYVEQDAKTTAEIYRRLIETNGRIAWISKKKKTATHQFILRAASSMLRHYRLQIVREAMQLPLPNTSFMKDPWKREKFIGWIS